MNIHPIKSENDDEKALAEVEKSGASQKLLFTHLKNHHCQQMNWLKR